VALADAKKVLPCLTQGGVEVPVMGLVKREAIFIPTPHDTTALPDNKYYIFW